MTSASMSSCRQVPCSSTPPSPGTATGRRGPPSRSTSQRGCRSSSSSKEQIVSGSAAVPEGITNPPIDELLEKTNSKYALVIYAAKRARQINAYYSQLGEGLLEYVGPLVETHVHEKPLSIALREINDGLLTAEPVEA